LDHPPEARALTVRFAARGEAGAFLAGDATAESIRSSVAELRSLSRRLAAGAGAAVIEHGSGVPERSTPAGSSEELAFLGDWPARCLPVRHPACRKAWRV